MNWLINWCTNWWILMACKLTFYDLRKEFLPFFPAQMRGPQSSSASTLTSSSTLTPPNSLHPHLGNMPPMTHLGIPSSSETHLVNDASSPLNQIDSSLQSVQPSSLHHPPLPPPHHHHNHHSLFQTNPTLPTPNPPIFTPNHSLLNSNASLLTPNASLLTPNTSLLAPNASMLSAAISGADTGFYTDWSSAFPNAARDETGQIAIRYDN